MSKAIVVYDSMFGNTEKIANALTRGIEKIGIDATCLKVDEAQVDDLTSYEFLALGGPTHIAGISKPMKTFLDKLGEVDLKDKKGFCFDTRNHSRFNSFDINSAAKKIEKKLKKMKVKIIKRRQSAIVEGREGPLEKEAELRFERIGNELAAILLNP